jgi:hypothetical protein
MFEVPRKVKKVKSDGHHGSKGTTTGTVQQPYPVEALCALEEEFKQNLESSNPKVVQVAAVSGIISAFTAIPATTRTSGLILIRLVTCTTSFYQAFETSPLPQIMLILRTNHLSALLGPNCDTPEKVIFQQRFSMDQLLSISYLRLRALPLHENLTWFGWSSTAATRLLESSSPSTSLSLPLERSHSKIHSSQSLRESFKIPLNPWDNNDLSRVSDGDQITSELQCAYPPFFTDQSLVSTPEIVSYGGVVTDVLSIPLGLFVVDQIHLLCLYYSYPMRQQSVKIHDHVTLYNVHSVLLRGKRDLHSSWCEKVSGGPLDSIICLVACSYSSLQLSGDPKELPEPVQGAPPFNEPVLRLVGGLSHVFVPVNWLLAYTKMVISLDIKFPNENLDVVNILNYLQQNQESWPRRHFMFEFCEHPQFCSVTSLALNPHDLPGAQPSPARLLSHITIPPLSHLEFAASDVAIIGKIETSSPSKVWVTDATKLIYLICTSELLVYHNQLVILHGARLFQDQIGNNATIFAKRLIALEPKAPSHRTPLRAWIIQVENIQKETSSSRYVVQAVGQLMPEPCTDIYSYGDHLIDYSLVSFDPTTSMFITDNQNRCPLLVYGGIYLLFEDDNSNDISSEGKVVVHEVAFMWPCFTLVPEIPIFYSTLCNEVNVFPIKNMLRREMVKQPHELRYATSFCSILENEAHDQHKLLNLVVQVVGTSWELGVSFPKLTLLDLYDSVNVMELTIPEGLLPVPVPKGTYDVTWATKSGEYELLGSHMTIYHVQCKGGILFCTLTTRVQWKSCSIPLEYTTSPSTEKLQQLAIASAKRCITPVSCYLLKDIPLKSAGWALVRIVTLSRIHMSLMCSECEETVRDYSCSCCPEPRTALTQNKTSGREKSENASQTPWHLLISMTAAVADPSGTFRIHCKEWNLLKQILTLSQTKIQWIERQVQRGLVTLSPKLRSLEQAYPFSPSSIGSELPHEIGVDTARLIRIALKRVPGQSSQTEYELAGVRQRTSEEAAWQLLLQLEPAVQLGGSKNWEGM